MSDCEGAMLNIQVAWCIVIETRARFSYVDNGILNTKSVLQRGHYLVFSDNLACKL